MFLHVHRCAELPVIYPDYKGLAVYSWSQALCVYVGVAKVCHTRPARLISPAPHAAQQGLPLVSLVREGCLLHGMWL